MLLYVQADVHDVHIFSKFIKIHITVYDTLNAFILKNVQYIK